MSFDNTYISVSKPVIKAILDRIGSIIVDGRIVPVRSRYGEFTDFPYITTGNSAQPDAFGKNTYFYNFNLRLHVWDGFKSGGYPDRVEEIADKIVRRICTRTQDYPTVEGLRVASIGRPEISPDTEKWDTGYFVFVRTILIPIVLQQEIELS